MMLFLFLNMVFPSSILKFIIFLPNAIGAILGAGAVVAGFIVSLMFKYILVFDFPYMAFVRELPDFLHSAGVIGFSITFLGCIGVILDGVLGQWFLIAYIIALTIFVIVNIYILGALHIIHRSDSPSTTSALKTKLEHDVSNMATKIKRAATQSETSEDVGTITSDTSEDIGTILDGSHVRNRKKVFEFIKDKSGLILDKTVTMKATVTYKPIRHDDLDESVKRNLIDSEESNRGDHSTSKDSKRAKLTKSTGFFTGLKNFAGQIKDTVSDAADNVKHTVTDAVDTVTETASHIKDTAANAAHKVTDGISDAIDTAKNTASNLKYDANNLTGGLTDKVVDRVVGAYSSVHEVAGGIADKVSDGISDAVDTAKNTASNLKHTANDITSGLTDKVVDGVTDAYHTVHDKVSDGIDDAIHTAENIKAKAVDVSHKVGDVLADAAHTASEVVENTAQIIGKVMKTAWGLVYTLQVTLTATAGFIANIFEKLSQEEEERVKWVRPLLGKLTAPAFRLSIYPQFMHAGMAVVGVEISYIIIVAIFSITKV